jgi:hypothetical protein
VKIKIFLASLFMVVSFINVSAEDICVSPSGGGSKNGTDWNNAADWSILNFIRGNTYYLADGTYVAKNLSTANSGAAYIYIKKATALAHGSSTGWVSALGDGQAILAGHNITTSYWYIDGITGSGGDATSYGFKETPSSCGSDTRIVTIPWQTTADSVNNITIKHVAFIGCGSTLNKLMYAIHSMPNVGNSNITISNNYFSGFNININFAGWNASTIAENYFADNWSSAVNHGESIDLFSGNTNITIKNNYFMNSSVYAVAFHNYENDTIHIYNNIFRGGNTVAVIGNADSSKIDTIKNMYVYNNTFVGITTGGFGLVYAGQFSSTSWRSYCYNNIFYDIQGNAGALFNGSPNNLVHDYNAYYSINSNNDASEPHKVYETTSPFVNYAGGNYRLRTGSYAVDNGITLDSMYILDAFGNARGSGVGGKWDIGAFEYIGVPPNPPANLRLN